METDESVSPCISQLLTWRESLIPSFRSFMQRVHSSSPGICPCVLLSIYLLATCIWRAARERDFQHLTGAYRLLQGRAISLVRNRSLPAIMLPTISSNFGTLLLKVSSVPCNYLLACFIARSDTHILCWSMTFTPRT